jgi:hypothetical protein
MRWIGVGVCTNFTCNSNSQKADPPLRKERSSRQKPMPHKFKIGETVVYRNTRRARVVYLNEDNGEPIYRIKHVDKGTTEPARESKLVKE